ncbi:MULTISPECIES: sensor histidine kinase [unclassified Streptomyces]|uniref:sensor histidine kinase n=1 Tax=unclassified Streptomyces TaxID=2593676 RepID=UPI001BE98E32|nr:MULTISPECIES: histidine kinase [unclassified Streptomyces]MBT2408206.1 histidine kinase [Streptomyces sp. ISL-21]MBT2607641.1 histidine kinase [Streptomyces sp. ISL-87]
MNGGERGGGRLRGGALNGRGVSSSGPHGGGLDGGGLGGARRGSVRGALGGLLGGRARLRWVHLILGGALLMPYFLLAEVVVGVAAGGVNTLNSFPLTLASYAAALPLAAATAVFGLVRPMSAAAVRAMCGVPGDLLAEGPARSWAARWRASAWWTLHLGVGALVSGMSLAVPPMALVLIALPFVSALRNTPVGLGWFSTDTQPYVASGLGIGLLAGLVLCAAGAGALLARLAPVLLGPTAADRLAAAEERAADLAVRNRLARELHDAVGHALSAVTLQAGAARRVLDSDPGFVREALAAIEDTTRRTVGELDAVLGLLRDGDPGRADALPAPTLAVDLEGLLARTRAAGTVITAHHDPGPAGDWAQLPAIASREAYRIVQEGLTNALRHGAGPVTLEIAVREASEGSGGGEGGKGNGQRELEISMTNPPAVPGDPGVLGGREPRTTGGRGLHGAAERAALLGGRVEAGPHEGQWRLLAVLPLGGGTR